MRLSDKQNIKEKLYKKDASERIYIENNFLRDARLIKWLTKSREIEVEKEKQWKMLIEFLEKEARVHQKQ